MQTTLINEYECDQWQDVEVLANKAMSFGYTCLISKADDGGFKIDVLEDEEQ